MLVLAIDTSSAAVTAGLVAVRDRPELLAARITVNPRGHGELLAPAIEACLHEAGAGPQELAAVVAGVGPGPFTGLRVGLVTAASISDALQIPAYGVCSLDAIARAAGPGRVLVATDARRREIYWARYVDGVRVEGPGVARPQAVDAGPAEAVAGAGARQYRDTWALPLREIDHPPPLDLVACARDRLGGPGDPLTPLYLRRPDAAPPAAGKAVLQ